MKKLLVFVVFSLIFIACEKNDKPEKVLSDYVNDRISGSLVKKDEILSKLTGRYWAEVNALSDEEFSKFENLGPVKKDSFKIVSNKCLDNACYITYSIKYSTLDQNTKVFQSEVKKVAEMRLEDGVWKISDISTVKTFHESLEPIKPLE